MRLIGDGVVDREGVAGLAARLGYSVRQLNRLVSVGARRRAARARARAAGTDGAHADRDDGARLRRGRVRRGLRERAPVQRHRARGVRAHAARAAAAARRADRGRRRARSRCASPTARRSRSGRCSRSSRRAPSPASRRRRPPAPTGARCACRTAPRSPSWRRATAACSARCGSRTCATSASPSRAAAGCSTSTPTRSRSPSVLASDPLLAPLVAARPGLRVPGCVDGTEIVVRAVLGQQISVAAARTHAARIVQRHGEPLAAPDGSLTHVFPTRGGAGRGRRRRARDAGAPQARRCAACAPRCATASSIWTPGRIASARAATCSRCPASAPGRSSTSPCARSAIPTRSRPSDLGVLHGLRALGVEADAREAERRSQAWRPFRAYTVLHLWKALESGGAT